MKNKIYSMIGLATKAGKLVSGAFKVSESTKKGKARLVLIAEDASDNSKKDFSNMCAFYRVRYLIWGNRDDFGHFTGKRDRVVLAITDEGFAETIGDLLDGEMRKEEE